VTPLLWLAAGVAAAGLIALAIVSSDDDSSSAAPELISASALERRLEEGVEARVGGGISDVNCSQGAAAGEQVSCNVRFDRGEERHIFVDVSGRRGDIRLDISVP
jgi:hypothetical protein